MILIALAIGSCETVTEGPIFNGETFVNFSSPSVDFPVEIGTTGFGQTLELEFQSTTLSSSDRTFGLAVVMDESDADPNNYRVPATFTIPANSFGGTLTIEGQDSSLEITPESFVLEVSDESGNINPNSRVTVNIFEVCPIPATYMIGDYAIGDQTPVFGGANFDPGTVTIAVGSTPTARTFDTTFFGNPITVNLNLVCDELIFTNTFDTGFTSAGAPIILRPASMNDSTYNVIDDSIFIVEYDNEAGGNGTFEGSFFLIAL